VIPVAAAALVAVTVLSRTKAPTRAAKLLWRLR
jgi:hypothetical protein